MTTTMTAAITTGEIYLGEEPAMHIEQIALYLHDNYNVRLSDASEMTARCGSGLLLPNAFGHRQTVAWTGDCIARFNNLQ